MHSASAAPQSIAVVQAVSIAFEQRLQPIELKNPMLVRPETPARGWLYWMTLLSPASRRRREYIQFGATYSSSMAPSRRASFASGIGHAFRCPIEFGNAGGFGTMPVTSTPGMLAIRAPRPRPAITGA